MNISVLGAGGMGIASALVLCKNNHNISIWTPDRNEAGILSESRQNPQKLPGAFLPSKIPVYNDMEKCLKNSEMVVYACPSQKLRITAKLTKENSKLLSDGAIFVSCSKGIEEGSNMLMSEILSEYFPADRIAALSGPSHAEEMVKEVPTAVVASSGSSRTAAMVQDTFMQSFFRVYTNNDIIGVETGGALKNIIALCAGISDGLMYGDNTRAALMTRGMAEISRLGIEMGASRDTFWGLAGIGDLIVTCNSMHSRNRRTGILIGKGISLEEAMNEIGMVVEGVSTVKPAVKLSEKYGVDMPIAKEAYKILFEGKNPRLAVNDLMGRDKKDESN